MTLEFLLLSNSPGHSGIHSVELKSEKKVVCFFLKSVLIIIELENFDFYLQKLMKNSCLHVYTYHVYTLSQSGNNNVIKENKILQEDLEIVHMPFLK